MEHSVEHHGSLCNKATLMDSDYSSQCTAKASLEKGPSWPLEAIPFKGQHMGPLLVTPYTSPTPWT